MGDTHGVVIDIIKPHGWPVSVFGSCPMLTL
jgi:hypothetical protein